MMGIGLERCGETANERRELHRRINELRQIDNTTNLRWIALEYTCLTIIIGGAVAFAEARATWGLGWGWNIPVFGLAIVLVGAIQHRLAGLGHEAAHYTLLKNKVANDLAADLFCMIPILTCVHLYRVFHMAHHQYTNDPDRDPDLLNMGRSTRVGEFPMPRTRFVMVHFLRWLTDPCSMIRYQGNYLYVNTLGKGRNAYVERCPSASLDSPLPRTGTWLGLLTLGVFAASCGYLAGTARMDHLVPITLAIMAVAGGTIAFAPENWLFRSPFRQAYGSRSASFLRLAYYLAAIAVVTGLSAQSDGRALLYAVALWFVPLGTSFSYFLLLRDVYQHSNADRGRYTNSRVFYPDPFTRWAIFVYGQDIHVTHHLHPLVPHYRLTALHRLLREADPNYATHVVECHGTWRSDGRHPTILDVLEADKPAKHETTNLEQPVELVH